MRLLAVRLTCFRGNTDVRKGVLRAIERDRLAFLKLAVASEGTPNILVNQSQSALMVACQHGRDELVRFLLDAGADVDLLDEWGWSALFFAISGGHLTTARLLLAHGADTTGRDVLGYSASEYATRFGVNLAVDREVVPAQ